MELDKEEINVVLYHGSCSDGFGSAFVVWLYYKNSYSIDRANAIEYIPCYHKNDIKLDNKFLHKLNGKNILMCDFSYKYDQLLQIIGVAKSFKIIDHHKTAYHDLAKISTELKIFDMSKSGVGLTWDYFWPSKPIPKFLAHIQDRDIWTYSIPNTLEFVTYFFEQPYKFDLWEEYLSDAAVNKAITIGKDWLNYKLIIVDKTIRKASYVIQEINNRYSIVIYCNSGEMKSDIGSRIFKYFPIGDFSCVWSYNLYTDQTKYSLRSTNKRYDVATIANDFGGGGHRNASGINFKGNVGMLPYKKIEDPGILSLMLHGTIGRINTSTSSMSYVLFNVKEINGKWLEHDYFELIKRKFSDCAYIIFQKDLDTVEVGTDMQVRTQKEYSLFYNEKASSDAEKQLEYLALASKERIISFVTTKNIDQLFTK